MKSVKRMIDRAAEICGSKAEAARRLGWTPQRLSDWESGRRAMPDEQIDALAHLIGFDPIKALGEYHHEWMRKKRATNARAGIAAAASFLVVGLLGGPTANTEEPTGLRGVDYLHIMRNLVARMRQIRRSGGRVLRRALPLAPALAICDAP